MFEIVLTVKACTRCDCRVPDTIGTFDKYNDAVEYIRWVKE